MLTYFLGVRHEWNLYHDRRLSLNNCVHDWIEQGICLFGQSKCDFVGCVCIPHVCDYSMELFQIRLFHLRLAWLNGDFFSPDPNVPWKYEWT